MKHSLIIWSKDRACQLHLLIESIRKNLDIFDIYVLWTASDQEFESGYTKLFNRKISDNVIFIYQDPEKSFRDYTLDLISKREYDNVCLSTDDTVIFRKQDFDFSNFKVEFSHVFSFRLGYNTIVQNPHANPIEYQPCLNFHTRNGDVLSWNPHCYHANHNYGYPLAMDMHMFDRENLYNLCSRFEWQNTNSLEGGLQNYRNEMSTIHSFCESVAVNIPTNNISGNTKSGVIHRHDVDYLNKLYLDNKVIDLDHIMGRHKFKPIPGCHHEFSFSLIDYKENQ